MPDRNAAGEGANPGATTPMVSPRRRSGPASVHGFTRRSQVRLCRCLSPCAPAEPNAVKSIISRILFPREGDDHSSRSGVSPALQRPTRKLQPGRPRTLPYLVLLHVGFTEPPASPPVLVRSYRTVSPLPVESCNPGCGDAARDPAGGLLSVALSVPFPGLGVTQHAALRSSDFPPRPDHKAGLPRRSSERLQRQDQYTANRA